MADAWKKTCQRTYQGWWVEDGSRRSSAVIRMYRRTTRRRLKRALRKEVTGA